MAKTHHLSIRTLAPSTNWRLFPNVVRYAQELFSRVKHQTSLANAWRLFVFLCKKHGHPKALQVAGRTFPIDRRALGTVEELGLSEGQIQRAIVRLLELGVIFREHHRLGYTHRRVLGGVQRLVAQYRFSSEMISLFRQAHGTSGSRSKSKVNSSSFKKGNEVSLLDRGAKTNPGNLQVRTVVEPGKPAPLPLFPRPIAQLPMTSVVAGAVVRPQQSPRKVAEPFTGASLDLMPDGPLKAALARLGGVIGSGPRKLAGQKPDFVTWLR